MKEYKFMIFNNSIQQAFIKNLLGIRLWDSGMEDKHTSTLNSITKLCITKYTKNLRDIGDLWSKYLSLNLGYHNSKIFSGKIMTYKISFTPKYYTLPTTGIKIQTNQVQTLQNRQHFMRLIEVILENFLPHM